MRRILQRASLALLPLFAATGCAPHLPQGVTCSSVATAGSPAGLSNALASAKPGSCVVPNGGTYAASFSVPAGVKLVAGVGSTVKFQGDDAKTPAITLAGGTGSGLYGITVSSAAGIGILVTDGPAEVSGVTVTGAVATALIVDCTMTSCLGNDFLVSIDNTTVTNSGFGLWARGTQVNVTGGASSQNQSTQLVGGYGVIASSGAALDVQGMTISGNQEVGVLVDGTNGTSAHLGHALVVSNQGRGVWAQGLTGTLAAPKLVIDGSDTLIDSNRIVGVGLRGSSGVSFNGITVSNTIEMPTPTDPDLTIANIGDGVGVFAATGIVQISNVQLTANARAQMVVDQGAAGIAMSGGASGGQYLVVIQNTTASVQVPSNLLSTTSSPLGVSTPTLSLQ